MNSAVSIQTLRATRDQALSIQNIDKDHALMSKAADTCRNGLDKFNRTGMYFGYGQPERYAINLTSDHSQKFDFPYPLPMETSKNVATLNEQIMDMKFERYKGEWNDFMDYAQDCYRIDNIREANAAKGTYENYALLSKFPAQEARAEFSQAELENDLDRLGMYGQLYSTVLHDPAYVDGKELALLANTDRLLDAAVEIQHLEEKMKIQDSLTGYHQLAAKGQATKEDRQITLQDAYIMLRDMNPAASTRNWQLQQIDQMNQLFGEKSHATEIQEAVQAFEQNQHLKTNSYHLTIEQIGIPHRCGGSEAYQKLDELTMTLCRGIEAHLYKEEKAYLDERGEDFRTGKDLSAEAFCAAALGRGTATAPKSTQVAGLLDTNLYPEKEIVESLEGLFPHANIEHIVEDAKENLRPDSYLRGLTTLNRNQFLIDYGEGKKMNQVRQGDMTPIYDTMRSYASGMTEQADKVEKVAKETLGTFLKSANKFLITKLTMPENHKDAGR